MISRNAIASAAVLAVGVAALLAPGGADAFTARAIQSRAVHAANGANRVSSETALSVFGKQEPEEDLSYIESRDLTREEMLEINRRNEEKMDQEMYAMTGISVLFSIPILYLCWVAFFTE